MKNVFVLLFAMLILSVGASAKILSEGITPTTTLSDPGITVRYLTDGKTKDNFMAAARLGFPVTEDDGDPDFAALFGHGETDLDENGCGLLGGGADGYIEFDLGAVCKLNGYRVYNYRWGNEYCMNNAWKLVVSTDGKEWKELHAATGIRPWQVYNGYNLTPTQARYVRLCITELYIGGSVSPAQKVFIYEWQLYGEGEPVITPEKKPEMIMCDGEELRRVATEQIKKTASVLWTPSELITADYGSKVNKDYVTRLFFFPGVTYAGPPYGIHHESSYESFCSLLRDGVYYGGTDTETVACMDCECIVNDAAMRIIPTGDATIMTYIERPDLYTPLCGIKVLESDKKYTDNILKRYTKQEMFECYTALELGDCLYTNTVDGWHIMMISDEGKCVRNECGTIDGAKSYVFITEEAGEPFQIWRLPDGEIISVINKRNCYLSTTQTLSETFSVTRQDGTSKTINGRSNFEEQFPEYTVIAAGSVRHRKRSYNDIYGRFNIPVTINAYHDNETYAPDFSAKIRTTAENIRDIGLLGRISANYNIISVTAVITKDGKALRTESIYPERSLAYLSRFTESNEFLKGTLAPVKYNVKITAACGPILRVGDTHELHEVLNVDFTVK